MEKRYNRSVNAGTFFLSAFFPKVNLFLLFAHGLSLWCVLTFFFFFLHVEILLFFGINRPE